MSNARYLEVDSTYRNRNEWPLAADFQIPISQTGRKGPIDAVDPVSQSASLKVWQSNRFDNNPTAATPSTLNINFVSTVPPVSATTGTVVIIVQSILPIGSAAVIQRQKDYYAAAVVQDTATNARARIISSTFMGTDSTTGLDRMRLTITTSLGTLASGTPLQIIDPTDFTSVSSPWIFIPNGRLQSNAYVSTVIHNQTRNQTRPLKDYQSFTHLGRIDTSRSAVGTNNVGPIIALNNPNPWALTDTYSIRVNVPQLCDDISAPVPLLTLEGLDYIQGVAPNHISFNLNPLLTSTGCDYTGNFLEINYQRLPGTTGPLLTTTTVDLNLGALVRANDLFVGCSLTITNLAGNNSTGETRVITSYDGSIPHIATVSPGFSDTPPGGAPYVLECPQEAKRIVKYVDYRGTTLPSSLPVTGPFVDFPFTASNKSGFYKDLYIRVNGVGNTLRLITNYQVTTNSTTGVVTRRAFLSSALPGGTPPVASFTITSGVTLPFSYSIAPGAITGNIFQPPASAPDTYQYACILPFSYDNLNPFVYTGSLVSQQDMVCYEVELLNLVLPNFVLAVAGGGNIAYYPYVYVELSNVSASGAHLKNIIYSNNPNSTRVLFRAAIDDVPNPLSSTFIKIDGDGAVQTIKFKPNDTLRFRVTMQCGQTFETIQDEWFSPSIPNPTAQISAYFSMKRL